MRLFQLFLLGTLIVLVGEFTLANKRPRPAAPGAGPPSIACIFPAAGQRGTTVEVTVIGENLMGASDVYVSGAGVTAKIIGEEAVTAAKKPDPKGGKAAESPKPWSNAQVATNRIRMSIAIAADAELGLRDLRLVTPGGLSPRWRFLVDQLPEVVVTQPNDAPASAVALASLPVAASGQLYSGWIGTIAIKGTPDRAHYRFSAKVGQTLVCQVQARELIPFIDQAVPGFLDACVTLRDSAGRRLAYADDFRFSPDPVLVHKVEKDGEYLLEVRDVIYRSNHDFIYRVRLGELPCLTHVFPLGGRRNSEAKLELYGVNLPGDSLAVRIPGDGPAIHWVTVERDGLRSNAVPLAVDDLPEAMEAEPNNAPAAAQKVDAPVVINGRIQAAGDVDCFAFRVEAGQAMALEVQARRLGSPLDSILTVFDAKGKKIDQYDDPAPQAVSNALGTGVENDMGVNIEPVDALSTHRADARIMHTFASAGTYVVRIGDVTDHGGQEYAYRLRIAPAEKDFTLRVKTDAVSVGQGDSAVIAFSVLRKNGFDGPVRVEPSDLPKGFAASAVTIPADQTEAMLTVTASADAPLGMCSPKFLGKAEVNGKAIQREGIPVETVGQAFYIKHMVPVQKFLLCVGKKSFYTLSSDVAAGKELTVSPGGEVKIVVKADRLEEGKGMISISAASPPAGIVLKAAQISPTQGEATVSITATPKAVAGTYNLVISGSMRMGQQTIVRTLPVMTLKVVAK